MVLAPTFERGLELSQQRAEAARDLVVRDRTIVAYRNELVVHLSEHSGPRVDEHLFTRQPNKIDLIIVSQLGFDILRLCQGADCYNEY